MEDFIYETEEFIVDGHGEVDERGGIKEVDGNGRRSGKWKLDYQRTLTRSAEVGKDGGELFLRNTPPSFILW